MEILTELRLRQWARKNYVAASERNDQDWHPVVLSEMRRRDQEVDRLQQSIGSIIISNGVLQLARSRHDIR